MGNRITGGIRSGLLSLAASTAVLACAGSAHAGPDGDVYGVSSLPLAQCDVRSAISAAVYEVAKRQAEAAPESIKMLNEFERFANASKAKASEPIYKGLSTQDNIRLTELSQRIKTTGFIHDVEDAYSRDLMVLDRIFVDAEGEYNTGLPPQYDEKNPKSESNIVYAFLLAMRASLDNNTEPAPAENSTECNVDYALRNRESEPLKRFAAFDDRIARIQSRTADIKAKYGSLDQTIMSKDDAADFQSMRADVADVQRIVVFIGDVENLRLLLRASGLRRESYIRDMMITGLPDGAIGGTLKRRFAAKEFDDRTIAALGLQDKFSSLFPSESEKVIAAATGVGKPK